MTFARGLRQWTISVAHSVARSGANRVVTSLRHWTPFRGQRSSGAVQASVRQWQWSSQWSKDTPGPDCFDFLERPEKLARAV